MEQDFSEELICLSVVSAHTHTHILTGPFIDSPVHLTYLF